MKRIAFVTALLLLSLAMPADGEAGDRPSATACLLHPGFGLGCATGTLGNLPPVCHETTCDVYLTATLKVTPVACGSIVWRLESVRLPSLHTCAYMYGDAPEVDHQEVGVDLPDAGWYVLRGHVCVSDTTRTIEYPCEELWHTFWNPGRQNAGAGAAAMSLPNVIEAIQAYVAPEGDEILVYQDDTFALYRVV